MCHELNPFLRDNQKIFFLLSLSIFSETGNSMRTVKLFIYLCHKELLILSRNYYKLPYK